MKGLDKSFVKKVVNSKRWGWMKVLYLFYKDRFFSPEFLAQYSGRLLAFQISQDLGEDVSEKNVTSIKMRYVSKEKEAEDDFMYKGPQDVDLENIKPKTVQEELPKIRLTRLREIVSQKEQNWHDYLFAFYKDKYFRPLQLPLDVIAAEISKEVEVTVRQTQLSYILKKFSNQVETISKTPIRKKDVNKAFKEKKRYRYEMLLAYYLNPYFSAPLSDDFVSKRLSDDLNRKIAASDVAEARNILNKAIPTPFIKEKQGKNKVEKVFFEKQDIIEAIQKHEKEEAAFLLYEYYKEDLFSSKKTSMIYQQSMLKQELGIVVDKTIILNARLRAGQYQYKNFTFIPEDKAQTQVENVKQEQQEVNDNLMAQMFIDYKGPKLEFIYQHYKDKYFINEVLPPSAIAKEISKELGVEVSANSIEAIRIHYISNPTEKEIIDNRSQTIARKKEEETAQPEEIVDIVAPVSMDAFKAQEGILDGKNPIKKKHVAKAFKEKIPGRTKFLVEYYKDHFLYNKHLTSEQLADMVSKELGMQLKPHDLYYLKKHITAYGEEPVESERKKKLTKKKVVDALEQGLPGKANMLIELYGDRYLDKHYLSAYELADELTKELGVTVNTHVAKLFKSYLSKNTDQTQSRVENPAGKKVLVEDIRISKEYLKAAYQYKTPGRTKMLVTFYGEKMLDYAGLSSEELAELVSDDLQTDVKPHDMRFLKNYIENHPAAV